MNTIADSTRKKYNTSSASPMPRPMIEIRPSVELVTLPENSAENFCSNVSGPLPPTVS
jgi:hypothetical protein